MFFPIPKNVTCERTTALLPTLIRWWEWLRAPEVERWQERRRVGWDATNGRNGGAERIAWATLLEMDRFDHRAGDMDQGAITLVLDLAEAFERASLPFGLVSDAFQGSQNGLLVLCGHFEHHRRVQCEGCVAGPSRPSPQG